MRGLKAELAATNEKSIVVAAAGAANSSGRLALSSEQQAQHWKRFGEQAFRMLSNGMVPLSVEYM